ncbi:hypothetical protein ACHAWF_000850 [Thalassiosira exigua]
MNYPMFMLGHPTMPYYRFDESPDFTDRYSCDYSVKQPQVKAHQTRAATKPKSNMASNKTCKKQVTRQATKPKCDKASPKAYRKAKRMCLPTIFEEPLLDNSK